MKEEYPAILVFVGIAMFLLSLLAYDSLPGLVIFSLSLILFSVYKMIEDSGAVNRAGNLLILSGSLSIISLFLAFINIRFPYIIYISVYIATFAVVILSIYYLYSSIKDILSFIEIKLRK